MNLKKTTIFIILFVIALSFAKGTICKVKIEGTIDRGLVPYIERSLKIAAESKANWILFEINTLGGRVDAAIELKDMILNSKTPTIAYIDKRAISAGALISLSCQKIIMSEGSSIGATTVVDDQGKKQSEKAQSYMRAEMGSTAEKYGRDKQIAQAMVDEDIEIPKITSKGKLLTFTAKEAQKHQFCDSIINSLTDVYSYLGTENPKIITVEISIAEKVIRFLTNPLISSLLMTIGFLGIIIEIKTVGWGISGSLAVIALALFFGSHYIINLANHIEFIMLLGGVILLLLEIFVIPGFGFAGIGGLILTLASFFMTMIGRFPTIDDLYYASAALSGAFILSILGTYFILKSIPQLSFFKSLVVKKQLHSNQQNLASTENLSLLIGKKGVTLTDLRLTGKIDVEGKNYHAISKNNYLKKTTKIIVHNVEGNKIIVTELQE